MRATGVRPGESAFQLMLDHPSSVAVTSASCSGLFEGANLIGPGAYKKGSNVGCHFLGRASDGGAGTIAILTVRRVGRGDGRIRFDVDVDNGTMFATAGQSTLPSLATALDVTGLPAEAATADVPELPKPVTPDMQAQVDAAKKVDKGNLSSGLFAITEQIGLKPLEELAARANVHYGVTVGVTTLLHPDATESERLAVIDLVQSRGGRVLTESGRAVSALVPVDALRDLGRLPGVVRVDPIQAMRPKG